MKYYISLCAFCSVIVAIWRSANEIERKWLDISVCRAAQFPIADIIRIADIRMPRGSNKSHCIIYLLLNWHTRNNSLWDHHHQDLAQLIKSQQHWWLQRMWCQCLLVSFAKMSLSNENSRDASCLNFHNEMQQLLFPHNESVANSLTHKTQQFILWIIIYNKYLLEEFIVAALSLPYSYITWHYPPHPHPQSKTQCFAIRNLVKSTSSFAQTHTHTHSYWIWKRQILSFYCWLAVPLLCISN